jgi:hypothetical protein
MSLLLLLLLLLSLDHLSELAFAHKRVFLTFFFVGWVCTRVLFSDCLWNLLDVMIIILL